MKKYLTKQIEEKRGQIKNLETAMIESENKEERAKLGGTLEKMRSELDEAVKMLSKVEEDEKENEQEEGEEAQKKYADVRDVRNAKRTSGRRNGRERKENE